LVGIGDSLDNQYSLCDGWFSVCDEQLFEKEVTKAIKKAFRPFLLL